MKEHQPIGGPIFTKPFFALGTIVLIAVFLICKRFIFGLSSVTHLNDGYPWGLWIVYDVVTGTAIACGGYAMALLVYIFNGWRYHTLVRSALLASMFGYTLAGLSIYLDVGRWWQLHNIFLPQHANLNSVMFEVAVCVACYVIVLWIEFSPAFFIGKPQHEGKLVLLKKVMFVFIALGLLFPTMHQSSLGSLMVIAGQKVHPLWQTNFLPLLFLMTAITMGFSTAIFEDLYSAVLYKRRFDMSMLSKIASVIPRLILVYFIIRFGDLVWRDKIHLILSHDRMSYFFILENVLYLIPCIFLLATKNRQRPTILFWSALSMVLAGGFYRFNTFLIAYNPGNGYSYFPAASEIFITLGIISVEIMAYLVFIKKLAVLSVSKKS